MIARAKEKQWRRQQRHQHHQQQGIHTQNIPTAAATIRRTDGNISWMGLPLSKTILYGVARKYKRSGSFFAHHLMTKFFVVQQVPKDVWNSVEWARARKRNIERSMRRSGNSGTIFKQRDTDDDSTEEMKEREELEKEKEESMPNSPEFNDCVDHQGKQLNESKHHQWQTEGETRRKIKAGATCSVGTQATDEVINNIQRCVYALAYYPSQALMEQGGSPRGALRLKDITEILLAEEDDLSVIVRSAWGELAFQTQFPRERNYWVAGLRVLCAVKSAYDGDVDQFVAWPVSYGAEPCSVIRGRSAHQSTLCGIGPGKNDNNSIGVDSQAKVDTLLKRARLGWQ